VDFAKIGAGILSYLKRIFLGDYIWNIELLKF
jgi:hypothetical protein